MASRQYLNFLKVRAMANDEISVSDSTATPEIFNAALARIAAVIRLGRKTHRESWRDHDSAYHANRAAEHVEKWESGDDSEPLGLQITYQAIKSSVNTNRSNSFTPALNELSDNGRTLNGNG
jgi:hypothetical protein